MPLTKAPKKAKKAAKRKIASKNISEFSHGATFKKTAKKFGLATARKQAIAVGLHAAGLGRKKKKR